MAVRWPLQSLASLRGREGLLLTTIHVRYEILDDPGRPDPDSAPDSFAWGVQAVGLPGNLSAFGVGDTLDEALDDLAEVSERCSALDRYRTN